MTDVFFSLNNQFRIFFIAIDSWQVNYSKAQKISSPNYTSGRLKPISVKSKLK